MEFVSTAFIFLFLPMLLLVYYNPILKGRLFRNIVLVLASLFFYAWGEPLMILLLLGSLLFNYLCGIGIQNCSDRDDFSRKKLGILVFSVLCNVAVLLFFKYDNALIGLLGVEKGEPYMFTLPLGISYYTFSSISYIVDVYRNKIDTYYKVSFIDVALYICFFGKITSGPIVQFSNIILEIRDRKESWHNVSDGLERFAIGFVKKIMIADCLSNLVAVCFEATELSVCMAWFGAIAYTLQIFFDFSGYTDMAIGVGEMFGFHLPENFNFPYCAMSISDFWKRWHISLTKWFTQYLYIPLGGNKVKSIQRHLFNLFVVWLFTGIWHGSKMTYIVWGLVYFVFQSLERYTSLGNIPQKKIVSRVYTLLIVVLQWVIFRSDSLGHAAFYIKIMFGFGAKSFADAMAWKALINHAIPLVCGVLFSWPVLQVLEQNMTERKVFQNILQTLLVILFFISVCITLGSNFSAALYGGF